MNLNKWAVRHQVHSLDLGGNVHLHVLGGAHVYNSCWSLNLEYPQVLCVKGLFPGVHHWKWLNSEEVGMVQRKVSGWWAVSLKGFTVSHFHHSPWGEWFCHRLVLYGVWPYHRPPNNGALNWLIVAWRLQGRIKINNFLTPAFVKETESSTAEFLIFMYT